jgi:WD40 repeat protein
MSHIFISYSRKDLAVAKPIVAELVKGEFDIWIDWEDIPKGEEFYQEIYHGIEDADVFLFLISPDSVQSEWCKNEIAHAARNGKRILPIVIRDTEPKAIHPEISIRNWIFSREGQDDLTKAVEEIFRTIHTDYEWLKYHTHLQVKALEWERKNQDSSLLLRGRDLRDAETQISISASRDPKPTDLQAQYVLLSRRNETRRQRNLLVGVGVALIISIGLGILAFVNGQNATRNANNYATQVVIAENEANFRATEQARAEEQTRIALSKQLAARSQLIADKQFVVSLLLGIEASKIDDNLETEQNLFMTLANNQYVDGFYFDSSGASIVNMEFTEDDKSLVVLTPQAISIVDVGTRQVIAQDPVEFRVAAISSNARWVALGRSDGQVKVIEVQGASFAERNLDTILPSDGTLDISSDGDLLLINTGDTLSVISLADEQTKYALTGASIGSFSPTGNQIVYLQYDKVMVINSDDGSRLASFDNHDITSYSKSKAFSIHDAIIALPVPGAGVDMFDLNTGNLIQNIILSPDNSIAEMSFSSDGNLLAVSSVRLPSGFPVNALLVSDIFNNTQTPLTQQVVNWGFYQSKFSHQSKVLASLGDKGEIAIWNMNRINTLIQPVVSKPDFASTHLANCPQFNSPNKDAQVVPGVHFSPSCDYFVESDNDGVVYLWNVKTGELLASANYMDQTEGLMSFMFSPDGTLITVGGANGNILLLDSTSLKTVFLLNDQSMWITSFAFSPDGRILASISEDATLTLWDVKSGKSIFSFRTDRYNLGYSGEYEYAAFSSDGRKLYSNGFVYDLDVAHWQTAACSIVGRNLTRAEWTQYIGNVLPYQAVCPDLPIEP